MFAGQASADNHERVSEASRAGSEGEGSSRLPGPEVHRVAHTAGTRQVSRDTTLLVVYQFFYCFLLVFLQLFLSFSSAFSSFFLQLFLISNIFSPVFIQLFPICPTDFPQFFQSFPSTLVMLNIKLVHVLVALQK